MATIVPIDPVGVRKQVCHVWWENLRLCTSSARVAWIDNQSTNRSRINRLFFIQIQRRRKRRSESEDVFFRCTVFFFKHLVGMDVELTVKDDDYFSKNGWVFLKLKGNFLRKFWLFFY